MKRQQLKRILEQITGLHLFRHLPHGVDALYDIKNLLPSFHPKIVFDVGANLGGLAKQYRDAFPEANLHCFEPVGNTFKALQENLNSLPKVSCHQVALGAEVGSATMQTEGRSDMYRMVEGDVAPANGSFETVRIETIPSFCAMQQPPITQIDFLKIDTEGNDMKVLVGAKKMLEEHRILLLQVEAGMHPANKLHVPMEAFKQYLEPMDYYLFGIYEQIPEWLTQKINLRRADLVFLSKTLMG